MTERTRLLMALWWLGVAVAAVGAWYEPTGPHGVGYGFAPAPRPEGLAARP